jgi:hypothetical protein
MIEIRLGDEIHFRNGEVSRVTDVHEMYQNRGFYLELTTAVHGFIGDNYVGSYWGYNPDGTAIHQDNNLVGNDIVEVIHKGLDDFLHLYRGDVIITSNGSEAKVAEDVVLLEKYTTVHLQDKININTEGYKASRQAYVSVNRDSLLIPSTRGPDTRIIKIIRGDRNEEKDV